MKYLYLLLVFVVLLHNCKSTKHSRSYPKRSTTTKTTTPTKAKTDPATLSKDAASIIRYAKQFTGVRYKYGGTTRKGMDCSGLVYTTFSAHGMNVPRTTSELSKAGLWIDIKKIQEGDLVFFATRKNSRNINHVGIVTDTSNDDIAFIHASSSKGVMISKLSQRYWYYAYVQARRYL